MLKLNVKHHISLRGYDNPAGYLRKKGFSNWFSHKLLNNKLTRISFSELENLCLLFGCTPNDLFDWEENSKSKIYANHPLSALKKEKDTMNFISGLTYNQLKEIAKIAKEKK